MSKTFERVFKYIVNIKEPKGHCEAVLNRHRTGLAVANRKIKRELRSINEMEN